jgi:two-component system cell cycle sensor histidine kinase/response regulator CckA
VNAQLAEMERSAPLRHEEKMGAVTRLAGGLSVDVGALVDCAAASVREALAVIGPTADSHQQLEDAAASLQRAAMIARQLSVISRGAPEHPVPRALGRKIRELVPLAERLAGTHVTVTTESIDDECWVEADAGQIEQVLFHLVVNARDAMPLGGDLAISVKECRITEPNLHRFGILPAGKWSVLEVADTGMGMDDQVLARLFEPFFTTKAPGMGSGLGLATVYGIARQLGGQVRVASAAGRGTRIGVWLPSAHEDDSTFVDPDSAVLVVDDDEWIRAITSHSLRRAGYGILEASDAEGALDVLRDVAGRSVRVVLTDIGMAGMSGIEFAAIVAKEHPAIRVVLMTGHGPEVIRAAVDGLGPILRKPFSRAQLLAAVAGDPQSMESPPSSAAACLGDAGG